MSLPAPGPVLETPRLVLTPVALTDFDDILRQWRDPVFTQAIMRRGPFSQEEVWFRLLRDLGHWQALGCGNWTLRLRETGAYVGGVGVLHYRRDCEPALDAPELGWGVGTAFQGQGLAREGLDAGLAWADTVLKAPRTVCIIDPVNAPSLRLAGRVGYTVYGETDYHDHRILLLERHRPRF